MTRHQEDEFDTVMENVSKNKDIERGLKHIANAEANQCDPVVREMATAVLHEIDKAKEKRAINNWAACVGFVIGLIFVIIITATGSWSRISRHY